MSTSASNEGKLNFPGMTARVSLYLMRLVQFPLKWGIPDQKDIALTPRPRLFRYDANRMRGMIVRAEHVITTKTDNSSACLCRAIVLH